MSAQTLDRPIDEVVVRGDQLPVFSNAHVALDQLHLYRWNGAAFEPIPFQFDEIKTWQLVDNLEGCPIPEDQLDPATDQVCETDYAFDFPTGTPGTDEHPGLDSDDELVFMARDAGLQAPVNAWVSGTRTDTRYDIRVADERLDSSGAMSTVGEGYVYLFRWPSSHAVEYGDRHYVSWEQVVGNDPDRNEACRGVDPVQSRRELACGWARGNASSTGQSAEPTLDLRFIGDWTVNRLRYRDAGVTSTPSADLLDRMKLRMGDCSPVCQSEYTWDATGCPRFVGLKAYDTQTKGNPIRVIRMSQGTDSGVTTTRVDWYYGTHIRTRVRLRVHPGVGPLRVHTDFLNGATPVNLWNPTYPASGTEAADVIDGNGPSNDPTGDYVTPGPTVFNWNEYESSSDGRFAVILRETRPLWFTSDTVYDYNDSGTSSPDNWEYDKGRFGEAGAKWQGATMDMQDKTCNPSNPDDPEKRWREIELTTVALPPGRHAEAVVDWLKRPLATYAVPVARDNPDPTPPDPCKPTLGSSNPSTGYSFSLSISTGCSESTAGYAVFRASGPGSFVYLTTLRGAATFDDASVRPGGSYRYKVLPFNTHGVYGVASDEISVTIADSTPPNAPSGLAATAISQGASVTWDDTASSFDTVKFDVYMSEYSGGPYQLVTPQSIGIPTHSLSTTSLDPTKVYYFVVKAIDAAGNESAYSDEVSVVPLP